VDANTDTDVITVRSYITKQLANNPLDCAAGQGIITVNSFSHGFKPGDYVLIIGSKNIGGISSSLINGLHVVDVLDTDTFTFEVNDRASEAASGGGATVKTGKPSGFRLMFDTSNSLIVNHLGFADEDSSELLGTSATAITTKALTATGIQEISSEYIEITSNAHGLYQCNEREIFSISQDTSGVFITTTDKHGLGLITEVHVRYDNCVPPINRKGYVRVMGDYTFILLSVYVNDITAGTGTLKYGGDQVVLRTINASGISDQNNYYVENVSANTFRINRGNAQEITTDTLVIGTTQIFVDHAIHGFNTIQSITDGGGNRALIITQTPHELVGKKTLGATYTTNIINTVDITFVDPHLLQAYDVVNISNSTGTDINGTYPIQLVDAYTFRFTVIGGSLVDGTCTVNTGDFIVFTGTNSVPSIDTNINSNVKYYIDVVSATSFYIDTGFTITTAGDSGIIGRNQDISLHRVVADKPGGDSIGGIPLNQINHTYHHVDKIIDENRYMIRVGAFSTSTFIGGGDNIVVSSQKHGYRVFQSNTYDGAETGALYKSISLEGENYLYLISNGLSAVYSPGNEKLGDVFAKLLLSEPPGVMIFDGFISAPLDFNPPISTINSFSFDFKRRDGYNFNFNNTDLSFSIRITEIVDIIEGTGLSSRTGTSDVY
jgi:hypothetical protein